MNSLAMVLRGLALLALIALPNSIRADDMKSSTRLRHPGRMVLADVGTTLIVANERSGSLSVIDTANGTVLSEIAVGQSLTGLATICSDVLACVDRDRHELVLLRRNGQQLSVTNRIKVSRYPQSLAVSPNATELAVTSLWSRRVTIFGIRIDQQREIRSQVLHVVDLPFAPREALYLADDRVLVADAFGGCFAIVETTSGRIAHVRDLPLHNIRGLAKFDQQVFVAHQYLHPTARTEFDDVHWGVLIENLIHWSDVAEFLKPDGKLFDHDREIRLGEAGRATGDPAGLVVGHDRITVTIAGTNECLLIDRVGIRQVRVNVGDRPQFVVVDEARQQAFVSNSLSDSVSMVNLKENIVANEIRLGQRPPPDAIDRGERAFFDASLSLDGWMSCHTCHADGHSIDQLTDTLGDGGFGARKRIPSLLGTGQTGPWAWNGGQTRLIDQLEKSVRTTMLGHPLTKPTATDLVAYLSHLSPPPSVRAAREESAMAPAQERGHAVFRKAGCNECHAEPHYTTASTFNVGLKDELGAKYFNPPSLRGASQRARLFHDGRAKSLSEAVKHVRHQVPSTLSDHDLADLVYYLEGL